MVGILNIVSDFYFFFFCFFLFFISFELRSLLVCLSFLSNSYDICIYCFAFIISSSLSPFLFVYIHVCIIGIMQMEDVL